MKGVKYCPMCRAELANTRTEDGHWHSQCPACHWIDYDNPVPVVAVLASRLSELVRDRQIVMVKRGIPPFQGEWCLPCGYVNQHEIPKAAACREMREETGLVVRLERILCVCNPMPGEINQITISYLGRITDGDLRAGDDAQAVRFFSRDDCPQACFRSHRMLIDKWWRRTWDLTGMDLD